MRILQVVPHYIPAERYGGPQRVAHNLGTALRSLGHEVTVCTTNLRDEHGDLDVTTDVAVDVDGINVHYCRTTLSRYWGYSPDLARRIKAELTRADVALIHAHFQYANWVAARLARVARVPYLIFPHSTLLHVAIKHRRQLAKMFYLRLFEWQNLRQATAIVFNAEEERERSVFGRCGIVVPNGIDLSDPDAVAATPSSAALTSVSGRPLFGFLGRLDVQQKALDVLLEAFALHVRAFPCSRLVVAGPDENGGRAFLEQRTDHLGIRDSVAFVGMLRGPDRFSFLRQLDAFVMASRFEGGSIALLEALSIGVPVLVSDQVGNNRHIVEARAGVVVRCEAEAVAAGLSQLADPGVRSAMRGNGQRLVLDKFSWKAIATELMAYIKTQGITG